MRITAGFIAIVAFVAPGVPAWADPAPVWPAFPAVQPSGISLGLQPYITIPPEAAHQPLAKIDYVQSVPGTGRLFVNSTAGILYSASAAGGTATAYLDVGPQTVANGRPGFSGFAFHPNFAGTPRQPGYGVLYTLATAPNTGQATLAAGTAPVVVVLREWTTANPSAATFTGTTRTVLQIGGYDDEHANGYLAFNPTANPGTADYGKLYIGSGDGRYNDGAQNAQRLDVPQGKLLRIDPAPGPAGAAYSIPSDNPFVGQSGKLAEIWASGLRNPESFGWDPVSRAMYINDLGQAAVEEVNLGAPGANYGWSLREGPFATGYAYGHGSGDEAIYPAPGPDARYTDPVGCYSHSEGYALGSGFVYRGTALAALTGRYVMADIVTGRLFSFDPASPTAGCDAPVTEIAFEQGGVPIDLPIELGNPDSGYRVDARLGQDFDGELLLSLKSSGTIYRLVQEVPEPAGLGLFIAGLAATLFRRVKHAPAGATR